MDVNTLRIIATLLSFATFIALLAWACSRRNRERFEEDAKIPFLQD
jgi:cytochrome c oxidase cbb3-type subunit IV